MPRQLTALVHATEGPWVRGDRMAAPKVRVCGLPDGETVVVTAREMTGSLSQESSQVISASGVHSLPLAAWFKVQASCRGVICTIFG